MPHGDGHDADGQVFSVVRKDGYVLVVYSGRQTFENLRELLHAILRVCDHYGCGKVMLDLRRGARGLSTVEKVGFAEWASRLVARENRYFLEVAYMVPRGMEGDGFFETAAYNRGLRARRFLAEQDARDWLVPDIRPEHPKSVGPGRPKPTAFGCLGRTP